MKIFLTGYMGAGKTSTGLWLARHFKVPFFDQDSLLEAAYGTTVTAIFSSKGETVFREYERDLLRQFDYPGAFIFSTGGGCPCFHQNMEWINAYGTSVYLEASAALLAGRLENGKSSRPLISGLSQHELELHIKERLIEREPFYQQASIQIQVREKQNTAQVAGEIIKLLPVIR